MTGWRGAGGEPLRMALGSLHLGVSAIAFIRPNMVALVPGYFGFQAIASTLTWGVIALAIGLGLLLIPRGKPLLILWQFASATFFLLFAILITNGPAGLNWGSAVYGLLGLWSSGLAYVTADDWFHETRSPQHFRTWLTKRWRQRGNP
ncbi:hypothetical protein [Deinococcus marmoris]|uniref:hypothetical protein n=1 Tax=Deinococcus marmoris TaxID=249408 RepID=UPI0012DCA188|nr:hypothetical protein [Deinococcus marmoris]